MGSKDDSNRDPSQDNKDIFEISWMNQCYNSLKYPDPACIQVMDKVNEALANRVTQPQGSELKQQALFSLLGPEFTDRHFPYHKYNVKILDTPKINPKMKEKYVEEMHQFLNKALDQAMKDCQYPKDLSGYSEDNEMGHYLQKVRVTFKEGLRKHTAEILQKEEKDGDAKKKEQKKDKKERSPESDSSDSEDSEDDVNAASMTGIIQVTKPSDICSEALLAIMAHDKSKTQQYMKKIKKRHLGFSVPLRQHFWLEALKRKEEGQLKLKEGEEGVKVILQNFSKKLNKEMKAQKISRAIRSNHWKAIDSSVIETYDNTSSIRLLDTDEHLIQTVRALNIHAVHSKEFSVIYINWLMPLQIAYPHKNSDGEQEHMMKLATFLDLLLRHCLPSIKDVFKMADNIVDKVKENDKEYYEHINRCLSNQVSRINVKDFPGEVLVKDLKAAVKLHGELQGKGSSEMTTKQQELFTNLTIFVRMWLIQGYAGVVSVPAGLWLWDELFLHRWSQNYLEDIGVAILSLIKPWMMRANMYSGARKVLLDEPGKIYLSDLRKSMIHLQDGGAYEKIPDNKNYLPPKPGADKTKASEGD